MVDEKLLEILVCPDCKRKVHPRPPGPGEAVQGWLACEGCGRRYPIRDDIPIMLIEEAELPGNHK